MTLEDVQDQVQQILADDDPETRHGSEDDLFLSVLRSIAAGAENSQELAAEALKSYDPEADRWYA